MLIQPARGVIVFLMTSLFYTSTYYAQCTRPWLIDFYILNKQNWAYGNVIDVISACGGGVGGILPIWSFIRGVSEGGNHINDIAHYECTDFLNFIVGFTEEISQEVVHIT